MYYNLVQKHWMYHKKRTENLPLDRAKPNACAMLPPNETTHPEKFHTSTEPSKLLSISEPGRHAMRVPIRESLAEQVILASVTTMPVQATTLVPLTYKSFRFFLFPDNFKCYDLTRGWKRRARRLCCSHSFDDLSRGRWLNCLGRSN